MAIREWPSIVIKLVDEDNQPIIGLPTTSFIRYAFKTDDVSTAIWNELWLHGDNIYSGNTNSLGYVRLYDNQVNDDLDYYLVNLSNSNQWVQVFVTTNPQTPQAKTFSYLTDLETLDNSPDLIDYMTPESTIPKKAFIVTVPITVGIAGDIPANEDDFPPVTPGEVYPLAPNASIGIPFVHQIDMRVDPAHPTHVIRVKDLDKALETVVNEEDIQQYFAEIISTGAGVVSIVVGSDEAQPTGLYFAEIASLGVNVSGEFSDGEGGGGNSSVVYLTEAELAALEDPPGSGIYPTLDPTTFVVVTDKEPPAIDIPENVITSSNDSIDDMIKLTYEEYNNLAVKDPKTRYIITDAPGVEEGIPMLVSPDYANMESINRITSNNGEWTVQETGYIVYYIGADNSANTGWLRGDCFINGARVGGASRAYDSQGSTFRSFSDPTPVSKGDVVRLTVEPNGGAAFTNWNSWCYFIPLKLTAIQPPVISDENFGNYLDRVNYDTRVDLYNQANPTLPYTHNIDYDGWCRIQVALGANSAVSIVAYPRSSSLDGSTIARFNGVAESEQYFKMIPVRNGDKLEIVRITGTVTGLVVSKYDSVFVAASAPIVTTRPKTYSTTEKQTDDVWYNGKPIYRKVYTGTFAKSTGTSSTNEMLENIPTFDQFVTVGGHVTVPSSNRNSRNIPYIGGDYQSTTFNFYSVYYNGAQKNLWFVHRDAASEDGTVDGTYVVWVEYTKTTD